nr:glycosyltransferase [Bacteroidales bacterium]
IVIVCMDRLDNLYPCLQGIQTHTGVSCETFVVAYRFSPENLARAIAAFPWVHWIESNEIRGFSENNNLALRQARGRYCFVVNDDTEIHEDVIGALVADLERLPQKAAIVSPRLLNADGSLQLCGRPPYPARYYVLQQWHLHREPIDDTVGKVPLFDEVFRTSNITGAAFLIKTEVFRELGWFDETYFFTPEDIALSTLARQRGYQVYVDRAVTLTHKWRTTASRISPAVRPAAVRGSLLFFSGGSRLKYLLLALPVWLAESAKRAKAALRLRHDPSEQHRIAWETFRNITRSIFTTSTPKQIFNQFYHGRHLGNRRDL